MSTLVHFEALVQSETAQLFVSLVTLTNMAKQNNTKLWISLSKIENRVEIVNMLGVSVK